jgi:nitroimidazol reductase NimA-like FMN-containing flavoprotein (pyridoxamine 5'-phosphate oxidase superfamily)/osmotically-inducible protein OsmY
MIDNTAVSSPLPVEDAPLFGVLEGLRACERILAGNNVGRIAFALQDRVSIVPVHYVYEAGWIYGRTAAGGKLREILRNRRVAFEIDEHTRFFEWRSVVVRGPLYLIEPGIVPSDQHIYAKAVSLIRQLVPSALSASDPVPFRDQLFRIRVVEISGRTSEPTGGKRRFPRLERATPEAGEAESDASLCRQVENALASVSISSRSQIHVDAFDGVIVLTGTAEDAAERSEVEAAVLGVTDVRAVVQQLETMFPSQQQPTPAEIAREALRQLRQAPAVLDPGIKVVAEHGWLRAEGFASSPKNRDEAVRRLRGVRGSRGVIDRLRVIGPVSA